MGTSERPGRCQPSPLREKTTYVYARSIRINTGTVCTSRYSPVVVRNVQCSVGVKSKYVIPGAW